MDDRVHRASRRIEASELFTEDPENLYPLDAPVPGVCPEQGPADFDSGGCQGFSDGHGRQAGGFGQYAEPGFQRSSLLFPQRSGKGVSDILISYAWMAVFPEKIKGDFSLRFV